MNAVKVGTTGMILGGRLMSAALDIIGATILGLEVSIRLRRKLTPCTNQVQRLCPNSCIGNICLVPQFDLTILLPFIFCVSKNLTYSLYHALTFCK